LKKNNKKYEEKIATFSKNPVYSEEEVKVEEKKTKENKERR